MAETSWAASRLRTTVRILWAVVIVSALLFVAAFMERSDAAPKMPVEVTPVFQPIGANSQGAQHRNLSHCTDGRGKDGVKNKHCRAASGQQNP